MSLEGAPQVPDEFAQYNSYEIDPSYAKKFTFVCAAGTGLLVLLSLPALVRSVRSGRIRQGWMIMESWPTARYVPLKEKAPLGRATSKKPEGTRGGQWASRIANLNVVALRSLPGIGLDLGQVFVVCAYLSTLLVCITYQAPLIENSNRAGFLSLAQLPFVFLFSMKASPLTLLLNRGYEKLNFIHRWSGRFLWLSATIHGSLWINNRMKSGQTRQLWSGSKEREGIAAYSMISLLALSSLRPVRRWGYNVFMTLHIATFVSFFIVICYHTPYATPWIIPPIAFVTFDVLVRLVRTRVKDAYLEAYGQGMTLIHIPDCSGGWIAGQHVKLRVFFNGRVFESHPLTITNAPPAISVTTPGGGGMILAARNVGDWSNALNELARSDLPEDRGLPTTFSEQRHCQPERRIIVMFSGPYGGPSFDFGAAESVLLVAGGAGVTFTLGVLDDLAGRIMRNENEKTKRVRFVWCVKDDGCIQWFTTQLEAISQTLTSSHIHIDFKLFVTCDPECPCAPAPALSCCQMTAQKPIISEVLSEFVQDILLAQADGEQITRCKGGGVAIGASGPVTLTRDMRNAVASQIGPSLASRLGHVQLHSEEFCL